ncbi:hypothetical protein [Methanoculleus chikugoensis]|nr:hypothetical protein [Methanoculleus chikugoensis]
MRAAMKEYREFSGGAPEIREIPLPVGGCGPGGGGGGRTMSSSLRSR